MGVWPPMKFKAQIIISSGRRTYIYRFSYNLSVFYNIVLKIVIGISILPENGFTV